MVSLIDVLDDGISAVYTFYEPSSAVTGLGTFGILWQIELAQRLNLPYIYLGFWIEGSEKMAYKSKFSATQILQNGQWQPSTSL
jgi:arginine-tRNA-protein transferase